MFTLAVPASASPVAYSNYPVFYIASVQADQTVTIQGYNFPAGDTFTVMMGPYGGYGIGGIVVDTTNSGSGGYFSKTYTIPAALKGSYQIAIRLQSPFSGYYAYNWFYNNTTGLPSGPGPAPITPGYGGYPYFFIEAVERNQTVTIKGYNFPAGDNFQVKMGAYGTYGIGGTLVETTASGAGGTFVKTYSIPAGLANLERISIRLESPTTGYYAFNWFWNFNANVSTPPPPPAPTPGPSYMGYPYFFISGVQRDNTVTIIAYNFPPNDTFTVSMGNYGGYGYGYATETYATGAGGNFTRSFSVPASLAGLQRIAIRLESPYTGYYAYNWFWNNTYP